MQERVATPSAFHTAPSTPGPDTVTGSSAANSAGTTASRAAIASTLPARKTAPAGTKTLPFSGFQIRRNILPPSTRSLPSSVRGSQAGPMPPTRFR